MKRRTLASYGPARGGVRVLVDADLVRVQWYENGARKVKSWPDTPDGRAEAKAWAQGFAEERTLGPRAPVAPRLTLRELWDAFTAAEFPALRPKTRTLYLEKWRKWELFLGDGFTADDARLEHLDQLRAAMSPRAALSQVKKTVETIRMVYTWGQRRELVAVNRLALYRFKVSKDQRAAPPAEYGETERDAILGVLSPQRSTEWRPWAAVMVAGHQGARMNAILHLTWDDVDWVRGLVTWRARWDKVGREWQQPLTLAGASGLLTAWDWRARDQYAGPWVFYSSHSRKRALGADPRAVYHPTALLRALVNAETRAGVAHRPYRGMHGFRRGVAGDVLAATKDVKLALDYIGDTDLRRAREYLQVRDERLDLAVAALDANANRHQTVTENATPWTPDSEPAEGLALAELGREDSNLQLPG